MRLVSPRKGRKHHGYTRHRNIPPEYVTWVNMRRRCYAKTSTKFSAYGGRGIRVCSRWDSFENFLADMGPRPSPQHSLDRINNDGNYEPGNCRWATAHQQSRNTRTNRWLTFRGKRKTLGDWAQDIGITKAGLHRRLRVGIPLKKALATRSLQKHRLLSLQGVTMPLAQWATRLGMSRQALYVRIKAGWSVKRALTTPLKRPR